MNPEPLGEIDPVKQAIARSVFRFSSGKLKRWVEFCEDLEREIRKLIRDDKK